MTANQCVICGAEMPEGDQVCRGCQCLRIPCHEFQLKVPQKMFFHWQGKRIEIPSVYWLAEAVREKMEREAKK